VGDGAVFRGNELSGHGGTIGRDFQHVDNRLPLLCRQSIARGANRETAPLCYCVVHAIGLPLAAASVKKSDNRCSG
jgi:hypothetical protein